MINTEIPTRKINRGSQKNRLSSGSPSTLRGALYLSLAASIWGAMFVMVRIAVPVIPPIPLVFMRYLTAIFALFAFGEAKHVSWHIDKNDWLTVFLVGLIGQTISIVTQETGTMLTSAQMGSIITAATPAFMVIFARLILREKLTVARMLSVVFATIGVLIIVAGPSDIEMNSMLGGVSLTVAALTWGLMSVLLKKIPQYSSITITFYGVLIALVLLAPCTTYWLSGVDKSSLASAPVWLAVLYLGIVSTAGGFIFWNMGLKEMDASVSGIFFFFQPIVGTLLGWLFLGEPVTIYFWVGSALVAAGVLLVMKK